MEILTQFERQLAKARAATKSPYGDVMYADPGFQKDKKKRYPLDTEEHVRAAMGYIMQPDNQRAYSRSQLSHMMTAIRTAAKKFGIDAKN